MNYRKPVVMNLGARSRSARGDEPMACFGGSDVGGWETCAGGTAALNCHPGTGAEGSGSCLPGNAATDVRGDCLSGNAPGYYCEVGTGGMNDPFGCRSGPSFA